MKQKWLSNLWPCPGGDKEVPRLRHPQGDDVHLEVPEQRLHARGVHQHLPQRQGDRDRLRRRGQAAGQMSAVSVHAPPAAPSPPAPSLILHPCSLVIHTPLPPSSSAQGLMRSFTREKERKLRTFFPLLIQSYTPKLLCDLFFFCFRPSSSLGILWFLSRPPQFIQQRSLVLINCSYSFVNVVRWSRVGVAAPSSSLPDKWPFRWPFLPRHWGREVKHVCRFFLLSSVKMCG